MSALSARGEKPDAGDLRMHGVPFDLLTEGMQDVAIEGGWNRE